MVRKGKALADPAVCEYPHGWGGNVHITKIHSGFFWIGFHSDRRQYTGSLLQDLGITANSYRGAPIINSWKSLPEVSMVLAPT